jgi:hypothetical protein
LAEVLDSLGRKTLKVHILHSVFPVLLKAQTVTVVRPLGAPAG